MRRDCIVITTLNSLPGLLFAVVAILGGDSDNLILLRTRKQLWAPTPNVILVQDGILQTEASRHCFVLHSIQHLRYSALGAVQGSGEGVLFGISEKNGTSDERTFLV
ncbi:hypothetical protein P3342_007303 [Pyrenophora teres f. teres]|nr:hypothetical protein P3342_007303 [Pyrenophora teres f. teres]